MKRSNICNIILMRFAIRQFQSRISLLFRVKIVKVFLCIFLRLKICPKLNKLLKKTFQLFEGSRNIQENLLKISFLFQKHPVVVCSYVLLYSRELLGWSIHFLRNAHSTYMLCYVSFVVLCQTED